MNSAILTSQPEQFRPSPTSGAKISSETSFLLKHRLCLTSRRSENPIAVDGLSSSYSRTRWDSKRFNSIRHIKYANILEIDAISSSEVTDQPPRTRLFHRNEHEKIHCNACIGGSRDVCVPIQRPCGGLQHQHGGKPTDHGWFRVFQRLVRPVINRQKQRSL